MPPDAKRSYRAPRREAAARRTRSAIVEAAKEQFEHHGWAGATMRAIAERAGVSQKTAEAVFGTKAALLAATVDYAIRGDVDPIAINDRPAAQAMIQAPTAGTFLDLHAAHLRRVHEGSAAITSVVELAALSNGDVEALWQRMTRNRKAGTTWATETLLAKPRTEHIGRDEAWRVFWVGLDWGTFRALVTHAGLDPAGYEAWVATYYRRMFRIR